MALQIFYYFIIRRGEKQAFAPLPAGIRHFSVDKSPLSDYYTQESVTVLFFHVQGVL